MPIIAITGASGGGKSSIIGGLRCKGFRVQLEVGREIVREQMASGSSATPWQDRIAFRDLLFQRSIEAYDVWKDEAAPVFFDRSFIEALAYSRTIGVPIPRLMNTEAQARPLCRRVFVCPPWPEIFVKDPQRKHDLEFALRDYEMTVNEYAAHGYSLVEVPKGTVEERVAFVLTKVTG